MVNKIFITCFLLFVLKVGFAADMVTKLNGFQIGQYRDIARLELGDPFKNEKYQDGFEYEIFLLKPDTSLYMIFEYSPANLQIIWSIQFTGNEGVPDFKNLRLGMSGAEVERILGKPSRMVDAGQYGLKWEYDLTNYSLEIDKSGKLSSIKITDESDRLFPKKDLPKIPDFSAIVAVLKSGNRTKIAESICPDIEVGVGEQLHSFKRKIQYEINTDESTLFKLINELSADLSRVNIKDQSEYEENLRVVQGQDPMHVIKLKKNHAIKEIVLKYQFGRHLIWEIKAL